MTSIIGLLVAFIYLYNNWDFDYSVHANSSYFVYDLARLSVLSLPGIISLEAFFCGRKRLGDIINYKHRYTILMPFYLLLLLDNDYLYYPFQYYMKVTTFICLPAAILFYLGAAAYSLIRKPGQDIPNTESGASIADRPIGELIKSIPVEKAIIICVGICAVGILVYPPYHYQVQRSSKNPYTEVNTVSTRWNDKGHALVFSPPDGATINTPRIIVYEIINFIIGGTIFMLARNKGEIIQKTE